MKFKLIEDYTNFDLAEAREFVQEYMYEAIDDLKSAPLEEYQKWFRDTSAYIYECNFDALDVAVKDTYIEAIDCGKIDLPKTMITSKLTDYLESHVDLIDKDIEELINNCPAYLKHELTLVLDKIDDSLNEETLSTPTFYHYSNNKYVVGDRIVKNTPIKPTIADAYNLVIPNHDCRKYVYMLDKPNPEYSAEYKYVYKVAPRDPVKCRMDFSPLVLHYDLSRFIKQTGLEEFILIDMFNKAYVGILDDATLESLCCLLGYDASSTNKFEYVSSDVVVTQCEVNSDN